MTPEQDKILSRVKKMLALAACDGATEGERDNALRMAHKILAAHNLSVAQVAEVGVTRELTRLDLANAWEGRVVKGVATLFFCVSYKEVQSGLRVIVGQPANVATAVAIAQYVIDSIKREVINRAKLNKLDSILGDASLNMDKSYKASFQDGAGEAIYAKCLQMRAEADSGEVATPGTAVTVASHYKAEQTANMAFLAGIGVHLRSLTRNTRQGAGFAAGQSFGSSINLNRQVGTTPSNLKRLK
jgi:hypothetical protein